MNEKRFRPDNTDGYTAADLDRVMSSEDALSYFYQADAWNSLGHPRIVDLNGREAIAWCEGGVWSPGDHGYAIYVKGVDY